MARGSWLSRAAAFLGVGEPAAGSPATEVGTPNDTGRGSVRLVLDTNVFVAAAYKPESSSRRLLDAVAAGRVTLLVSPPVFGEYRKVLPKSVRSADAERRIREWLALAEAVDAGRGERVVAADASDDKFVELALEGRADAIVSSDGHLLGLAGKLAMPVLRPGEAVRLVEQA